MAASKLRTVAFSLPESLWVVWVVTDLQFVKHSRWITERSGHCKLPENSSCSGNLKRKESSLFYSGSSQNWRSSLGSSRVVGEAKKKLTLGRFLWVGEKYGFET